MRTLYTIFYIKSTKNDKKGRRTTLKEVNCIKIHNFNDASAEKMRVLREKQKAQTEPWFTPSLITAKPCMESVNRQYGIKP